jgi:hypothetical protein
MVFTKLSEGSGVWWVDGQLSFVDGERDTCMFPSVLLLSYFNAIPIVQLSLHSLSHLNHRTSDICLLEREDIGHRT